MAAYNKYLQFTKDLIDGVHDFDAHVFKVMLTNTTPVNTHATRGVASEITAGNGYPSGGTATACSTSTTGASAPAGTAKATFADVIFTCITAAMATFRWPILYNDTPTSPADPLIAYWDYGSAITLQVGETFTWDADPSAGVFTVA